VPKGVGQGRKTGCVEHYDGIRMGYEKKCTSDAMKEFWAVGEWKEMYRLKRKVGRFPMKRPENRACF